MKEVLCYRLVSPDKVGIASLSQAELEDQLHWIHLSAWPWDEAADFLAQTLEIHPDLVAAACSQVPARRPVHRSQGVALSLSLPSESEDLQTSLVLGIIASGSRIVTLSPEPCTLIADLIQTWVEDPEGVGENPPQLLFSVIDEVADSYAPIVDRVHDRVESLEEDVFEERAVGPAAAICLKRELLVLRRDAGGIREAIQGLLRHGEPWAPGFLLSDYQDTLNHVLRTIESTDIARDIISSILDAQASIASNRLNANMRVLTVISTVLMSASLIAGIYGMNVRLSPDQQAWWGFPFALGLMALSMVVSLVIFRKKGWI